MVRPAAQLACLVSVLGFLAGPLAAQTLTDSAHLANAVAVATQRMTARGNSGFSRDDLQRLKGWFTPELYALLLRDMSGPDPMGYLNFIPFTKAQDDVSPARFSAVSRRGDTVMVDFAFSGYSNHRYVVRLAMRSLSDGWRIANFIYPDNAPCHRDLAEALARFAASIAGTPPSSASCGQNDLDLRSNEQLLLTAHDAVRGSLIPFASRIVVVAPQQNCGR
jgi:hypothetical protein